jgi:hypothetical protein
VHAALPCSTLHWVERGREQLQKPLGGKVKERRIACMSRAASQRWTWAAWRRCGVAARASRGQGWGTGERTSGVQATCTRCGKVARSRESTGSLLDTVVSQGNAVLRLLEYTTFMPVGPALSTGGMGPSPSRLDHASEAESRVKT